MTRTNFAWLLGYLLVLAAVAWGVCAARSWALERLNNEAARAQREEYLASARAEQAQGGPVQHKIPTTNEPPELVLLRDRFWVVMTAGFVFASLFYAFTMYVVRGLRSSGAGLPERGPLRP